MVKPPKRASKRTGTKQREKIKKKVAEAGRKSRRAAKKDVTWKSKKKADPGIPNSYPYKEQLLREIEEKRDKLAEERKAAKEARRKGGAAAPDAEDDEDDDDENQEGGPRAISNAVTTGGKEASEAAAADPTSIEELLAASGALAAPAAPLLFRGTLTDLKAAMLQDAEPRVHAVICALDARDPFAWRVPKVEQLGANTVLVLMRADLVPLEALAAAQAQLQAETSLKVFSIAAPSKGEAAGVQALVDHIVSVLPAASAKATDAKAVDEEGEDEDEEIKDAIVVVGMENAGRTSLASLLAAQLSSPSADAKHVAITVYDSPPIIAASARAAHLSETEQQEVEAAEDAEDAAAEQDEEGEQERERVRDELAAMRILIRNSGSVDKIKEPLPLLYALFRRVTSTTDLMLGYNVPAFGAALVAPVEGYSAQRMASLRAEKRAEEFLIELARARGRFKKGNVPDQIAASRILLRDWASGALGYYTPRLESESTPYANVKLEMARIQQDLGAAVLTRKDWRKRSQGRELRLQFQQESLLPDRVALSMRGIEEEEDDEDEEDLDEEDDAEALGEDGEDDDAEDDDDDEDAEDDEEWESDAEEAPAAPVVAAPAKPRSILKKTAAAPSASSSKRQPAPAVPVKKTAPAPTPASKKRGAPVPRTSVLDEPRADGPLSKKQKRQAAKLSR